MTATGIFHTYSLVLFKAGGLLDIALNLRLIDKEILALCKKVLAIYYSLALLKTPLIQMEAKSFFTLLEFIRDS